MNWGITGISVMEFLDTLDCVYDFSNVDETIHLVKWLPFIFCRFDRAENLESERFYSGMKC